MADLSIDMFAYQFGQGLVAIGLMFEAAKGALLVQRADLDDCIAEYCRAVEFGADPIGEWEDGNRLWDQEDLYRLQKLAIDDAVVELRRATAIAIYHHWERHVPGGDANSNRRMKGLLADACKHDIPCHDDIDALYFTANYLKHGNDLWRRKLLTRWPDLFAAGYMGSETETPWVRQLSISDRTITWFLDIAKHSTRPVIKNWHAK